MSSPVTDDQFEAKVLKSETLVLVDFWASWCGPCKSMEPIIDKIAAANEGKLKVMKMNVDESPETPMKYNIMSIPTFMIFKNGQIASQFVGVRPQEFVQKEIDSLA
ncbi:MAG TPA: thioredoxin [Candidatus Peribacteraceae bacterium]|nr:thioredoxin [Candidatus Peribacteraceae bacterium]